MKAIMFLERTGRPAWIGFSAIFLALIVLVGIGLPTNHDEYQYLSAAWLYRDHAIYRDYFYSQTQYYAALNSLILRIVTPDGEGIFELSRFITVAWSFVFFGTLSFAIGLTTPGRWLQIGLVACVFTSQFMGLPLNTARNDMMPLALASSALLALVLAGRREGGALAEHFAAGAFLSLALWTKQSFLFIVPALGPYLVHMWWIDGWRRTWRVAAALGSGGVVASIPAFFIIARAPENFIYSVGTFHRTQHVLWTQRSRQPDFFEEALSVAGYVMEPSFGLILLIGAGFLAWIIARERSVLSLIADRSSRSAIFCFSAMALVGGSFLLAKPFHLQYASPILPFAAVFAGSCAGFMVRGAGHERRGKWIGVCNIIGIFALAFSTLLSVPHNSKGIFARARALVERRAEGRPGDSHIFVAEQAAAARKLMGRAIEPRYPELKIATVLSPYPIEVGYSIYPELASAPFFYRTNDHLSEEQLARLVGTSPGRIKAMLYAKNAQAVLVGYDREGQLTSSDGRNWENWPKIETGLVDYAKEQNFRCFETPLQKAYRTKILRLYVAPEIASGSANCL